MTKQAPTIDLLKSYIRKCEESLESTTDYALLGALDRRIELLRYAIKCIENLDILIDYVVEFDNQDIICDDLYGYDEVDGDCWCSRNCKNFNRECVITWLEWKRGNTNG